MIKQFQNLLYFPVTTYLYFCKFNSTFFIKLVLMLITIKLQFYVRILLSSSDSDKMSAFCLNKADSNLYENKGIASSVDKHSEFLGSFSVLFILHLTSSLDIELMSKIKYKIEQNRRTNILCGYIIILCPFNYMLSLSLYNTFVLIICNQWTLIKK